MLRMSFNQLLFAACNKVQSEAASPQFGLRRFPSHVDVPFARLSLAASPLPTRLYRAHKRNMLVLLP